MDTMAMVAFLADMTNVIMNQASFALQKSAHHDLEKDDSGAVADTRDGIVKTKKSVFCTAKGGLGLVMLVVGALLHIFAVANADLTLLSCNSAVGIIANGIISTRYLGERFDPFYDSVGLSLIAFGSTVIVLFSNKEK